MSAPAPRRGAVAGSPAARPAAAAAKWAAAWPDALGFAAGLALAWTLGWETRDLVWSLWLSSLCVGYAMIVWRIARPGVAMAAGMWGDRGTVAERPAAAALVAVLMSAGGLFMLAFFTVHFGGFHFVHSVFLNQFFPVATGPEGAARTGLIDPHVYLTVLRDYWMFVPLAALAERRGFAPLHEPPPDTAVTPAAIARRKRAGDPMMAPYKNVIRLHLLIFFFAGAHFAGLERSFAVYAVVYAVYFFPWSMLAGRQSEAA